MQFLANIFVRSVLTDLLDTSCQQLYPIVNIAMNNNFKHCHMCTLHDFLSSKVRFIHTSTATRSQSCPGKKTTRKLRVHLKTQLGDATRNFSQGKILGTKV